MKVTFQAAAPPSGLLEVTPLPAASTATQKLLLGQDTPFSEMAPSTPAAFHPAAPPFGLPEVNTLPPLSVPTQRVVLVHETLVR
jgi:hypothetical protein